MHFFRKTMSLLLIAGFITSSLYIPSSKADLTLPRPGSMVDLSPAYEPALLKGLTVHKDNPFLFDFIMDTGRESLSGNTLKAEGDRLVKYFFASLAIPEKRSLGQSFPPMKKAV